MTFFFQSLDVHFPLLTSFIAEQAVICIQCHVWHFSVAVSPITSWWGFIFPKRWLVAHHAPSYRQPHKRVPSQWLISNNFHSLRVAAHVQPVNSVLLWRPRQVLRIKPAAQSLHSLQTLRDCLQKNTPSHKNTKRIRMPVSQLAKKKKKKKQLSICQSINVINNWLQTGQLTRLGCKSVIRRKLGK